MDKKQKTLTQTVGCETLIKNVDIEGFKFVQKQPSTNMWKKLSWTAIREMTENLLCPHPFTMWMDVCKREMCKKRRYGHVLWTAICKKKTNSQTKEEHEELKIEYSVH